MCSGSQYIELEILIIVSNKILYLICIKNYWNYVHCNGHEIVKG